MKHMLNVRTPYKRSDWYNGMRLDPTKDNVLSMRNDDLHGKLRSKMAAGVRIQSGLLFCPILTYPAVFRKRGRESRGQD